MLGRARMKTFTAVAVALLAVCAAGEAAAAAPRASTISGTLEVDASYYPGPGYPLVYYWLRTPSGRVLLPVDEKDDNLRNVLSSIDGAALTLSGRNITGTAIPVKGRTYTKAAFAMNLKAPLLVKGRLEAYDGRYELRVTRDTTIAVDNVDFLEPNIGRPVWAKVKLEKWVFARYPSGGTREEIWSYYDLDDEAPLKALAFLPIAASASERIAALAGGTNIGRGARTSGGRANGSANRTTGGAGMSR